MRCIVCKVNKLSNEFPLENLTDACDHPALSCFRCCLDEKGKEGNDYKCSHPNCDQKVNKDDAKIKLFEAFIEKLFPKPYSEDDVSTSMPLDPNAKQIFVKNMVGQQKKFAYDENKKIRTLKKSLIHDFGMKHVDESKLMLKYGKTELKDFQRGGTPSTLGTYKVPENAVIYMAVVLFSVPKDMKEVLFEIFWKLPATSLLEYVDVSCVLYKKKVFHEKIDFETLSSTKSNNAVNHSGDKTDRKARVGMQIIEVQMEKLPADVDRLFFVVSNWKKAQMKQYYPVMRFYDARDIFRDLCSTSLEEGGDKAACILCCMVRDSEESASEWNVLEIKKDSDGNVRNYDPIKNSIEEWMSSVEDNV